MKYFNKKMKKLPDKLFIQIKGKEQVNRQKLHQSIILQIIKHSKQIKLKYQMETQFIQEHKNQVLKKHKNCHHIKMIGNYKFQMNYSLDQEEKNQQVKVK